MIYDKTKKGDIMITDVNVIMKELENLGSEQTNINHCMKRL